MKPTNSESKNAKQNDDMKAPNKVQGEGDYEAARAYDKDQRDFIEKNKKDIPSMARDAEQSRDADRASFDEAEAKGKSKARH